MLKNILFLLLFALQGFAASLETKEGQLVLRLQGSPYERGYQHGSLLKEQIQQNIAAHIDTPRSSVPGRIEEFTKAIPLLMSHVPEHFKQEMQGIADGSGVPLNKIIAINLFPEMFHCIGMTVCGAASKNGELYHVRVLDYAIGKNLHETAVLQIVEPDEGIAFLNVGYAGFIGSITGMNAQKIALGEIGGQGYGSWNGMPMPFLLRDILQYASSLDAVKARLESTPRTCEYYYVFSDGKTKESIGVYATADQLKYISPGEAHTLSPLPRPKRTQDSSITTETTPSQTLFYEKNRHLAKLSRIQPKNCLLITGFPNPERYPVLFDRVMQLYGSIDAPALMQIIKQPVARPSNLHNAIFQPSALKAWISHAGPSGEAACDQPYVEWDLSSLLNSRG